jgi:glucose-1-phosphate cytidylyltransferase
MGLPLLTLSGRTFASRMAGSLLTHLELPELIATSLKEYEEKAVRFAKKPAELKVLKSRLKDSKASGTVFNIAKFVKEYESCLFNVLEKQRKAGNFLEIKQIDNGLAKENRHDYTKASEVIHGVSRMKAVILAGGFDTCISEGSCRKPNAMQEIGGRPILWHIMKIYSSYGINEFIICLGYNGYIIKEFFANYFLHTSNVTFDMVNKGIEVHHQQAEPWRVTLVDTGENITTGGCLRLVREYVGNETFCCAYGDCVADIPINQLIAQHLQQQKLATFTAIRPTYRYGQVTVKNTCRSDFQKTPAGDDTWTNGGFFVFEPGIFDCIEGDEDDFEGEHMQKLLDDGQLAPFHHNGFWQLMDTMHNKVRLEELWRTLPPWKKW